jgi:hypothetical protein
VHPDDRCAGAHSLAQPLKNIPSARYPFSRFGVKERRQTAAGGKEEQENIVENDAQKLDFYMGTNVKVNG